MKQLRVNFVDCGFEVMGKGGDKGEHLTWFQRGDKEEGGGATYDKSDELWTKWRVTIECLNGAFVLESSWNVQPSVLKIIAGACIWLIYYDPVDYLVRSRFSLLP